MTPSPSPSSAVRAAVDELEGLLAKATPGEWRQMLGDIWAVGERTRWQIAVGPGGGMVGAADAALIVAAVNALPHLLAAIKAVDELAAMHYCSEISDGFGGYECGCCHHSWAHTLPGGEGCPTVRALRAALALAAVDVTETAE